MKSARYLAGLLTLLLSTPALAADADARASLSLQFQGVKLGQKKTSRELTGSDEEKETYTSVSTSNLADSYVWLTLDKWNIYYYPFVDSGLYASVGYRLMDALELGATFGWNSEAAKEAEREYKSSYIAPFAWYYASLGSYGWEQGLVLGRTSIQSSVKDSLSGDTYASQTSSNSLQYTSILLLPLAKNFWMTSGLTLVLTQAKVANQPINQPESELKVKERSLALQLLGFRLTL